MRVKESHVAYLLRRAQEEGFEANTPGTGMDLMLAATRISALEHALEDIIECLNRKAYRQARVACSALFRDVP